MTNATRDQLRQAYTLIQQEELDKAISLLEPILAENPDNPDAWWLMANAVSEPDDAFEALSNVLRLDPNHAQARDLLETLKEQFPQLANRPAPAPASSPSRASAGLDDLYTGETQTFDQGSGESFVTPGSTPAAIPASGEDLDLDALFASAPIPGDKPPAAAAAPARADLDDVFAGSSKGAGDLDNMFSDAGVATAPAMQTEETDLDAIFASSAVKEAAKPKQERGRWGRGKGKDKKGEAQLFDEPFEGEPGFIAGADLDAEKPARERRGKPEAPRKPTRVAMPPESLPEFDPFEAERAANRRAGRRGLRALFLLFLLVAAGAAVVFVVLPALQPAPSTPTVTPAPTAVAGMSIENFNGGGSASPDTAVNGETLQFKVCGTAGPDLRDKIFQALELIAPQAAKFRDTIKASELIVVSCATPDVTLFRATAPMDAIVAFVDGGATDTRTYRTAWKQN